VAAAAPLLTAALERPATAKREGIAGLENLQTMGDLVQKRLIQERDDLVKAQQAMDRVHCALKRLDPILPVFKTFLARFVRAASARMAQHEIAAATARIGLLSTELERLRLPSVGLREATALAAHAAELTGEAVPVPTIAWPADLLAPPVLAE
jgi:hypothetical protein